MMPPGSGGMPPPPGQPPVAPEPEQAPRKPKKDPMEEKARKWQALQNKRYGDKRKFGFVDTYKEDIAPGLPLSDGDPQRTVHFAVKCSAALLPLLYRHAPSPRRDTLPFLGRRSHHPSTHAFASNFRDVLGLCLH